MSRPSARPARRSSASPTCDRTSGSSRRPRGPGPSPRRRRSRARSSSSRMVPRSECSVNTERSVTSRVRPPRGSPIPAASARSLSTRRCVSTRLPSDEPPSRTRIPVQRSNGSNEAAWMTRVPPRHGLECQLHSLSKPVAAHAHPEARVGSGLEALDVRRLAEQAEPRRVRRAGRRGGRPGRGRRAELDLREERRRDDGSWSVAHTSRGDAWTNTRRSTTPSARRWSPGRRKPTSGSGRTAIVSDPDRVPDRLHLEEGGDPFGTLGGAIVEPVEAGVGHLRGPAQDALDVVGGEQLDVRCACRRGRPTCRSRRRPRGRPGPGTSSRLHPVRTLTTPPGTSEVASTSLRVTAGSGRVSEVMSDHGVPRHERRREPGDQPQQRRRLRRDDARRRRSARGS